MRVKAYVIHYTPLRERKAFLKNQLEEEGVDHAFVEEFDKEALSVEDYRRFDLRRVRPSMCSNIMKHVQAYYDIYRSSRPYNLILEDDAVLSTDFLAQLHRGLDQLPSDFDMLFIGDGLQMHIPSNRLVPDQYVYRKGIEACAWGKGPGGAGATRCTDSYLVSKKCAGLLIKYVDWLPPHAINANSDFWLNDVIRRFKLRIYWLEPTIVTQGTQTGMYDSSHGRGENM
jgi:GR25 family glycosyltransferase involved in LPS biosynthesis